MHSYSLHIGVNKVDPKHYLGWNGVLAFCENDARFYHDLALEAEFSSSALMITSAHDPAMLPTSKNLNRLFRDYTKTLEPGDFFFLTYSGHGSTVKDVNMDEDDWQDETWCLYDRQYIDDELWAQFSRFKKGVKIFLVSDSCHSGSVARAANDRTNNHQETYRGSKLVFREAPEKIASSAFTSFRDIYLPFVKGPIINKTTVNATIMQFGACQDDEKAAEINGYGLFTGTFKQILETCTETDCYEHIFEKVTKAIPSTQHPNLLTFGHDAEQFLKETFLRFR